MKYNYPLIFATLTFIFVFLASYNVYLFGDDYYYITFSQGKFSDFIAHHIEHYKLDNGRVIVHILVSIFLSIDLIWWKIFNSLMLSVIVYFGAKLSSKNTLLSGAIFFLGVCGIGINVSRQSIYWLTGSINYVYPIFLLIIFWFAIFKYIKTYKYTPLMCIFAFIASATVEQGAMMVFGLIILLGIKEYIINKKINKKFILILIFSALGVASVILSPATFNRYAIENQENLSLIIKFKNLIAFLINSFFFASWILPYNIIFAILGYNKLENKFLKVVVLLGIPVFIIASLVITENAKFDMYKILISIYLLLVYSVISIKNISHEIKNIKNSNLTYTISTILLIGSQIMLVVSSVYGYRNQLFGIFMLLLMISAQTTELTFEKITVKKLLPFAISLFIILKTISNQSVIIAGYYNSNKIERENINKIYTNTEKTLSLKKPDINYTWSMPYVSKYHEYYYKHYYNLDNIEINWN